MKKRYIGNKIQPKKPGWMFKCYRGMVKAVWPKDTFVYLGEHFPQGSLIISNHASLKGPLGWEFHADVPIRFLGAVEMNGSLKSLNHYQIHTYYVQRKHFSLAGARLLCIFASPLTWFFYRGLDLISIRRGLGFLKTINDAYTCLTEYKENLMIFPEDAEEGYADVIAGVKRGFTLVLDKCLKNGFDIPVVVSYCHQKEHVFFVREAIMYSELVKKYKTSEAIADFLKDELNKLGSMDLTPYLKKKKTRKKKQENK